MQNPNQMISKPMIFDEVALGVPLLDILEEKLGRELDDKEADYVSKLEKRYRRFAIEQARRGLRFPPL